LEALLHSAKASTDDEEDMVNSGCERMALLLFSKRDWQADDSDLHVLDSPELGLTTNWVYRYSKDPVYLGPPGSRSR
jgi:hypothetical protein